jgi:vancomycin resistance protein VanJ
MTIQPPRIRRPWQQRLVAGYAIFIELWLFLEFLTQDRFWPLAILNSAGAYLFVPLLPLAALAYFSSRRRLLFGMLAFPALSFLWLFGGLFLPRLGALPAGTPLRAMTYNVLNSNRDFAAIAGAVTAAAPDLVGFEELTSAHWEALGPLLAADYPYQALDLGDGISDVGFVSRYPIESAEAFALPPRDLALRAVVNVNGRHVHMYVIHLPADNFTLSEAPAVAPGRFADRANNTAQLRAEIEAISEPVLLLCDCNLTSNSYAYRNLRAVLGDSFAEAGSGFGHTLQPLYLLLPINRIDYIWHSAAFYAQVAQVGVLGGSDHHALWADLILTGQ